MKAILIPHFVESYTTIHPTTIPAPYPTPTQLLISTHHTALNYIDLLYARGKHQNNTTLVRPPFTLGLEFAGVVVSAPLDSAFKPGDRVFGSAGTGAFAEHIAVEEAQVRQVPQGWRLREAAGIAATAPVSYGALVRAARVERGETVLVHAAAGGLGVAAVQIARALGCNVIGTVGSAKKVAILRRLGVEHIVDYSRRDWVEEVMRITGGKGVDVTFDPVGLVEQSIRCSKFGARVLVVGFAGREGDLEKVRANRVLLRGVRLIGYRYGETLRQTPAEGPAIWAGVEDLMAQGLLKPVIYDEEQFIGLESVPRAMEAMAARKIWGKAIIDVKEAEPRSDSRL